MDLQARTKLGQLIEKASKTTEGTLDAALLKQFKDICRTSNENVRSAYQLLQQQLKVPDSQKRYWLLMLIDELFMRSKYFRSLFITDFRSFMELVIGTRARKPLPPPAEAAEMLRKKGLEFIEKWNEGHGAHYKQLRVGYHYLEHTLKMTFPHVRLQAELREREQKERERKTQEILRVKFARLQKELEEFFGDMRNNLKEMESCFDILIPQQELAVVSQESQSTPTTRTLSSSLAKEEGNKEKRKKEEEEGDWRWAGFVSSDEEDDEQEEKEVDEGVEWEESERLFDDDVNGEEDDRSANLSVRGLGNTSYELEVSVDKSFQGIEDKSEDGNAALFDTVRNSLSLLVNRHYDLIKDWVDILVHLDLPVGPTNEGQEVSAYEREQFTKNRELRVKRDRVAKVVIDLKAAMDTAQRKCKELGIHVESNKNKSHTERNENKIEEKRNDKEERVGEDEEKDEEEEEEEEGEDIEFEEVEMKNGFEDYVIGEDGEIDPSDYSFSSAFDVSSYSDSETAFSQSQHSQSQHSQSQSQWDSQSESQNDFNSSSQDERPPKRRRKSEGDQADLGICDFEYPRIKTCRAPLPTGDLCTRRDKYKCPFHGPIIPRDDAGFPSASADKENDGVTALISTESATITTTTTTTTTTSTPPPPTRIPAGIFVAPKKRRHSSEEKKREKKEKEVKESPRNRLKRKLTEKKVVPKRKVRIKSTSVQANKPD